jgi:hypothetical protein
MPPSTRRSVRVQPNDLGPIDGVGAHVGGVGALADGRRRARGGMGNMSRMVDACTNDGKPRSAAQSAAATAASADERVSRGGLAERGEAWRSSRRLAAKRAAR